MSQFEPERSQCPHCKADLQGKPIPRESQEFYGGHTHFRREVLVSSREHDVGLYYKCPDCPGAWHRWPKDSRYHAIAESVMSNLETTE